MYKKNDLIYVFFGDLKSSILHRNLSINRFGKIKNIEEVGLDMYHYSIECKDNKLMQVKSYDNSFNICNIEELMDIIYTSNISEKTKDFNIEILNDILDFYE